MNKSLFSINRAADLLERDRQTLVRALRHVPPDGYEAGQPRWRMPTIVEALGRPVGDRGQIGKYRDRFSLGRNKVLDGLRLAFDKALAEIEAEPEPAKRRELALATAPMLLEYQTQYLGIARSLHVADDDVVGNRADLILSEMLEEVSEAADWPRHGDGADFYASMMAAMGEAA